MGNYDIVLDKILFSAEKYWYLSYFSTKHICCGYSLEAPHRGASNKYPQHKFSWRKKNTSSYPGLCKYDYCFLHHRDAGGAFGKMEAAHEEQYFRKLVRTQ